MSDGPASDRRGWFGSAQAALPAVRPVATARRLAHDRVRGIYHSLADGLETYFSPLVLDRGALQATCRRQGALFYYAESEAFELDVPDTPGEPTASITDRDGEHLIPAPFVGELPEVTLVGRYPMPIHERRLVLEAIGRPDIALLNCYYSLTEGGPVGRTDERRTLDRATVLHNCWDQGYFHWVTEGLTRLEGIERYHERTGERPTLVLGPDPPTFQVESLRLLGYDETDWIEWDGTTTVVNRLVVPSMRRGTNRGSEVGFVAYRWLRDRLRTAVVDRVDADRFSARVYVSRADADRRRIVNEREVMDVLSEHGFEAYRLGEMSFAENVALFAGAEVVVAPHGAGLTNLLYAEDATVVELFRPNNVPTYFVLARQFGHRHRYLECEARGVDLWVDPDELNAVVAETLPGDKEPADE